MNGHSQYVIPDSVSEFNLLTNQFSAEYGHSAGGQFNTITKSGTNDWHGDAWEYNNNRNYNAYDNLQKENFLLNGIPKPRSDFNRFGTDMGGPILHNKLFIYGALQRIIQGLSAQAVSQHTPTAAGLATLESIADPAAQDILKQFPTAPASDGTETVTVAGTSCAGGCPIPIGPISPLAPSFLEPVGFHGQSRRVAGKACATFDALYDSARNPNVNVDTPQPQFTGAVITDVRKYLFKDTCVISNRFVNEYRMSYTRLVAGFAVPPALQIFPTLKWTRWAQCRASGLLSRRAPSSTPTSLWTT